MYANSRKKMSAESKRNALRNGKKIKLPSGAASDNGNPQLTKIGNEIKVRNN